MKQRLEKTCAMAAAILQQRDRLNRRGMVASHFRMLCCLLCFSACAAFPAAAADKGTHLIVIGVDGLYPHGIEAAQTPNIHAMMKEGSWSFHARAVFPTVSSPN